MLKRPDLGCFGRFLHSALKVFACFQVLRRVAYSERSARLPNRVGMNVDQSRCQEPEIGRHPGLGAPWLSGETA
jgi:hypothetical protein